MSRNRSSRRRPPASRPRPASGQHELTTKRRGELAELAFTLKAASLGFGVSKPYGDSERYDVILDARTPYPCRCPFQLCVLAQQTSAVQSPQSNPIAKRRKHADHDLPRPGLAIASFRGRDEIDQAPTRRRNRSQAPSPRSHSEQTNACAAGMPVCPLDSSAPLWRVQVKCSTQLLNGLYRINGHRRTHGRALPYLPSEIHFLAAYIIPEDTWYIIPLHAVRGTSLLFRRKKDHRPGLYDQYREAWQLLRPK